MRPCWQPNEGEYLDRLIYSPNYEPFHVTLFGEKRIYVKKKKHLLLPHQPITILFGPLDLEKVQKFHNICHCDLFAMKYGDLDCSISLQNMSFHLYHEKQLTKQSQHKY